ncbi:bifunctional methylenetetrahydrofolate dehydrogenase/methenyltetrahydrofolate cyclohydrolase FolD [Ligilactobacillus salivarius]|uniref:Bifunctional protein FolD n=2 Tax=Ligilactobacillus salivarius TaxID=1624 RepID=V6DIJ7_9LACO|nr:bifunctional methylenetetrahydrofolate dehydrogenase/methenyltetrahydrofolate cyclohydrolase FolD [Ligilactobacillus salivarius]WII29074.1 bifunctional methylenetetrahydrofolate dehydrogenase/methenyltetrahydrofolate cyclohydrolase FolD [Ligilactobacillus salivarius]CDK34558.1 Methylenetetrahydrofolate dehydrogenase (NADP+) / Methenyltetrahydrofolate cyclohydrolase [Ligilactobacillus salivarius cp400]
MVATILDGRMLSKKIRTNVSEKVSLLKQEGITPKLVVILVGEDPASQVYVRNKRKTAHALGIEAVDIRLPENVEEDELIRLIDELNSDGTVHGILVQLPLPKHINENKVTYRIIPEKDVDGFHPLNIGKLFMNIPGPLPCTPRGIMEFFKEYDIPVSGKRVVIVGRSNIVGRPMAALLVNSDATVTIAHSKTKNLAEVTKQADILIVAIGKGEFIDENYVKKGAVVIDVGMNRNNDGKLVGDVNMESVSKVASYITPVPGGVGPMTIAMLMKQTVELAERSVAGE